MNEPDRNEIIKKLNAIDIFRADETQYFENTSNLILKDDIIDEIKLKHIEILQQLPIEILQQLPFDNIKMLPVGLIIELLEKTIFSETCAKSPRFISCGCRNCIDALQFKLSNNILLTPDQLTTLDNFRYDQYHGNTFSIYGYLYLENKFELLGLLIKQKKDYNFTKIDLDLICATKILHPIKQSDFKNRLVFEGVFFKILHAKSEFGTGYDKILDKIKNQPVEYLKDIPIEFLKTLPIEFLKTLPIETKKQLPLRIQKEIGVEFNDRASQYVPRLFERLRTGKIFKRGKKGGQKKRRQIKTKKNKKTR